MISTHWRFLWWAGLAAVWLLGGARGGGAGEAPDPKRRLRSDPLQEYYVYLPKDFDAQKRYWLFVAVHGLGGNGDGALGWADFADEGQCIVVGPTFKGRYQFPTADNDIGRNMIAIHKELSRKYRLHRKFFVTGFSAGAQFAHRFALECPRSVGGCAAHSAGSWETPNTKARRVPFVVTCGADDEERIHAAKSFAEDLERKRYQVTTGWFKGVGHQLCDEARKLTKDLYWSATTGMTMQERDKALATLETGEGLFKEGKFAEAYTALITLARAKRKTEFSTRATSVLRQIAALGKKRLMEIQEQANTDPAAATKALEKLRDDFKGFKVAGAAARLLAKLKSAKAADTTPTPKQVEPERPREEKPKPMPAPRPKPDGQKAREMRIRWLNFARNLIANDKKDAARRYLDRIIRRFPDSPEADEAKLLLMGL